MALQITGNIVLNNGISISQAYCRLDPKLTTEGNIIMSNTILWSSKDAYTNSLFPLNTDLGINELVNYDRTTDGVDILQFATEWIKFQLESKGYTVSIIDL